MQTALSLVEPTASSIESFALPMETFKALIEQVKRKETKGMSHSDLERNILEGGREALRLLFEEALAFHGEGDVGESVTGSDGMNRNHQETKRRTLTSLFGKVSLSRKGYTQRDEDIIFPKDAVLNLPKESHSYGIQKAVAREVSKGSYEDACESLAENTGVKLGKRQAEAMAKRAVADFDDYYEEVNSTELASAKSQALVVLSSDGKGIVMRREDLREATRKRSEQSSPKLKHRMSKGEKKNSKRMATVGAVYHLARYERTAEDIVGELAPVRAVKQKQRPRAMGKRIWASLEKSQKEVIAEIFEEASRRDPKQTKPWIYLVDGEKPQLEAIKKQAKAHGVKVTIVLDLIHVIEYLWKAARAFYAESSPECEAWVNKQLLAILRGQAGRVAGVMKRLATLKGLSKKKREPVDACATYLKNNAPYLHYDKYLAEGYPIATGVIEGACRHLIKDRMDVTGARWSLEGAEAVLKLRSLRSSGDFNRYWEYHETKEYQRNHEDRYDDPAILNKIRGNSLKLLENSSS